MLLEDMLKGVLSKARGCPEIEALEQMRHAVRQWCKETRCLTRPARVMSSSFQDATQMADLYVVDVVDAQLDGEPIDVLPVNDSRLADATETCPRLVFDDTGSIHMVPEQTTPVELDLLLVLAPGPDATEVPDVLWQRYAEHLVNGALARVLSQEGEAWAKPAKAVWHETRWLAAISDQAALSGKNRLQRATRLRSQPV